MLHVYGEQPILILSIKSLLNACSDVFLNYVLWFGDVSSLAHTNQRENQIEYGTKLLMYLFNSILPYVDNIYIISIGIVLY